MAVFRGRRRALRHRLSATTLEASEGGTISILVVDVGTSSVRGSIVRDDGTVETVARRSLPPSVPAAGL
ncbi:MAG: hypothetical protein M3Y36_10910, partial [Actinomycetota bacterium]|nr:hypothetical protein [Actinomycetota bacterium]